MDRLTAEPCFRRVTSPRGYGNPSRQVPLLSVGARALGRVEGDCCCFAVNRCTVMDDPQIAVSLTSTSCSWPGRHFIMYDQAAEFPASLDRVFETAR